MTALRCARRGDHIAVLDRDGDAARTVAQEALTHGAKSSIGMTADVTHEIEVEDAFAHVNETMGPIWGLFANAAVDHGGLIHELPLETWNAVIATNLTGVFLSCKYALRQMLAACSGGSIVCASSPGASVAFSAGGAGAYSASKGGVSALVRCMAIDYAMHGIRVNAIVPGATETKLMWNNVPPARIAGMRDQLHKEIPLGRIAAPEEPANAIAWLLSDDSSYVTGSELVCDGGVLAKASISV